jgi:hypothetical protein
VLKKELLSQYLVKTEFFATLPWKSQSLQVADGPTKVISGSSGNLIDKHGCGE